MHLIRKLNLFPAKINDFRFKVCLAISTQNFNRVKITHICSNLYQAFATFHSQ